MSCTPYPNPDTTPHARARRFQKGVGVRQLLVPRFGMGMTKCFVGGRQAELLSSLVGEVRFCLRIFQVVLIRLPHPLHELPVRFQWPLLEQAHQRSLCLEVLLAWR